MPKDENCFFIDLQFFSTDICPAQSEAQMPARGGAAFSPGDEPEQRRMGSDLVEDGRLVGHGHLHLQVQRVHQGAAGGDQDDCSEESFIRCQAESSL